MEGDKFPIGLKVLVVDDSRTCLMYMKQLLVKCKYKVSVCTEPKVALEMLRENKERFDIVISDVHMPEMDGLKLLEQIGLELDIPVIMSSGDDNLELVMKGVTHGAVDYLVKPVRIEEVKNIWQHVIRKNQCKQKGSSNDGDSNENPKETRPRKRKEQNSTTSDADEEEDSNSHKKPRVVWSAELHKKFVHAVDQLGLENAYPKKILDFMNEERLTRENVASHLQKYRLYLKKMNASSIHSTTATQSPFMIQNSPFYMNGAPQMHPYHSSLSLPSSYLNMGNHFHHQNSTNFKPQTGVPSLQDYSRCMENWRTRSFNGGFSSNEISYLKNALENPYVQVAAPPAQNVAMVPNIDEGNQSFMQNGKDEGDEFMGLGDSFLDDSAELLAGFSQNDCESLDDIVAGLLKKDDFSREAQ